MSLLVYDSEGFARSHLGKFIPNNAEEGSLWKDSGDNWWRCMGPAVQEPWNMPHETTLYVEWVDAPDTVEELNQAQMKLAVNFLSKAHLLLDCHIEDIQFLLDKLEN